MLDGRYRLVERLAAGGMGVVYRAERLGLARQVAVKFLHRSSALVENHRLRFEREAAAMSRVTHPNLVGIIDYGSADGVPYLVMDFHPGVSLRGALKAGAMPPRRALHIARQILAGIGSAHASSVVHRDLKPANVLLVGSPGEDLVKILDFGVAKLIEGDGGPSDLSAVAGHALGTPEYMAPEQARCERVDHRTDIYAIGVLLYEMLTGRLPFQAEGDLAILHKHIEETPRGLRVIVPEISAPLEAATLRALEKDPQGRWQSAAEFSRALAALPEGGAVAPPEGATAEAPAARPAASQPPAPRTVTPPARRAMPPHPPPGPSAARPRLDTPGMPTIAARPAALARVGSGTGTHARPAKRRWRRALPFLALVIAAAALGFAASQDALGLAWPSWLPWS